MDALQVYMRALPGILAFLELPLREAPHELTMEPSARLFGRVSGAGGALVYNTVDDVLDYSFRVPHLKGSWLRLLGL